jgi:SAM-dependent methyltransferase
MNEYFNLAAYYDKLMPEDTYRLWAACCEAVFSSVSEIRVKTVLDLACGTGTLSYLLAEMGYEVIGADISCEMLAMAENKKLKFRGATQPIFLNQPAEELDLYGTVQAAVCSMDGVNYIQPLVLEEAFKRVSLFLEKGGVFIFDINTPEKFAEMDGEAYVDEADGIYCVWRADYAKEDRECAFSMDIFIEDTAAGLWRREYEEHIEYDYTVSELKELLKKVGFGEVAVYGGLPLREAADVEERLFFVCKK